MSVKEQRIEELTRDLQEQTDQSNRMSGEIEGMLDEGKCFSFHSVLNCFNYIYSNEYVHLQILWFATPAIQICATSRR